MATLATTPDARIGFADQTEELRVDAVPVTGTIPRWLRGGLVRVTPAQMDLEHGSATHWFDGLAMLHRFGFADGTVSYASRFLDTEARRGALATGRHPGGFGTDPCRSLFQRVQSVFHPDLTDNANVNLTRLGDDYLAMTETPMPVVFDPETLETLGHVDVRTDGQSASAHPHHDPAADELVNFHAKYGRVSEYRVVARAARDARRVVARMPGVREPAYMHSFALTPRFAVLLENPLVVNPLRLATGGRAFIHSFRWKPELGLRVHAFDRATGALHRSWTLEPCFVFHTINAYEDGGDLVVDLCAYEDATIIGALELERLRTGDGTFPAARPVRLTLPLGAGGGPAAVRTLAEVDFELPRIDYRHRNGRPYRHAYGTGTDADGALFASLVKLDVEDGTVRTWSAPDAWPGEPVFVPRPGRDERAEDDGVVLAVTLDAATGGSYLLVLDAATFTELGRAEAPHRVPFGFHGQFFGA